MESFLKSVFKGSIWASLAIILIIILLGPALIMVALILGILKAVFAHE